MYDGAVTNVEPVNSSAKPICGYSDKHFPRGRPRAPHDVIKR